MSVELPNEGTRWGTRFAWLCGLALVALTQMGNECGGGGFAPQTDGPACLDDFDCVAGDACVAGQCLAMCTSDAECVTGRVCGVMATRNGTVQTCVLDEAPQNNIESTECASDAECQASNMLAACSVDGLCFVPDTISALLIEDVTPATALELPADGYPGADVAAVYLVDRDDQIVAYGDTLTARDPNAERVLSPIIGDPPRLDADEMCVQGTLPDAAASLGGEGGFILLQFVDLDGIPVNSAPDTWRVVVIEWSDNCDASIVEDVERIRVRGCVGTNYDTLEFDSDCDVELGQPFAGKGLLTATGR